MICAHCSAQLVGDPANCPDCGAVSALDGRYALLEVLGQGAAGMTYKARVLANGAIVAIKEVLVRRISSVKALALFEREAQVLEQLQHPAIPRYVDDFTAGSGKMVGLYLVQEFIDGESLASESKHRRYTEADVLAILAELLDVVAYLQSLEPAVVHRDIKPGNVMRRRDGRLVLIDFGVVKDVLRDVEEAGSTVAGTFGYMAPEQLMGRALRTTDLYGLGALAVALLTRRDPSDLMTSEHRLEWREAVDVAPDVEALLAALLQPEPERRPASAAALAEGVRAYLAGDPARLRAEVGALPGPRQPEAPAGGLLGRIGQQVGDLIAQHLNASVPGLPRRPLGPPPPPAPRPLPQGFTKRVAPMQRFLYLFGSIWLAVSSFTWLPILALGIPVLSFLMPTAFAGLGLVFVLLAHRKVTWLKRTWASGRATLGQVRQAGYNRSLTINGRNPYRLEYVFEVDGRTWDGQTDGWDPELVSRAPGDPVHILFDADNPRHNVAYW